jgi:hypothetical protein
MIRIIGVIPFEKDSLIFEISKSKIFKNKIKTLTLNIIVNAVLLFIFDIF